MKQRERNDTLASQVVFADEGAQAVAGFEMEHAAGVQYLRRGGGTLTGSKQRTALPLPHSPQTCPIARLSNVSVTAWFSCNCS